MKGILFEKENHEILLLEIYSLQISIGKRIVKPKKGKGSFKRKKKII